MKLELYILCAVPFSFFLLDSRFKQNVFMVPVDHLSNNTNAPTIVRLQLRNDDEKRAALPLASEVVREPLRFTSVAQEPRLVSVYGREPRCTFISSRKGGVHLVQNHFVYRSNMNRQGREMNKIYWECIHNRSTKCRGRLKSIGNRLYVTNGKAQRNMHIFRYFASYLPVWTILSGEHNHPADVRRVEDARRSGSLMIRTIDSLASRLPGAHDGPSDYRAMEANDTMDPRF